MNNQASNKASEAKNWLRGGQIVEHNIRMFKQNIKRVGSASLFIASIYIIGYVVINTTAIERKLAFNYYFSYVIAYIAKPTGINHITYQGKPIQLKHQQVIQSSSFIQPSRKIQNLLIKSSIQAIAVVLVMYLLVSIYIRKRGQQEQADKFLRGGSLVDNKQFKKTLNNKLIHRNLSLGSIPILKNKETQHFEVSGTSGTGKSTTFNHLIASIKARGDRALIYSSSTEFITSFYNKDKDIILNPLDNRFPGWNMWGEVKQIYHYDDVATALIPDVENGQNDPIWTNAARLLFADTARTLKQGGDYSTKKLIDTLLAISDEQIKNMLKSTMSSIIFSQTNKNKTSIAESVRFTLVENIKSLRFLTNDNSGFSIRDWVRDESTNQGSIFVTALADQKEVLKPLISCWVDIFASSVLSLPESNNRRIWLIIDELAGLHRLRSLLKMAAETRKYGGCVAIGYQNYSDIQTIYGEKGAAGLSNLTQNKVFFRAKDEYNARRASTQLGKEEVKTTNNNLSMGSENIRDSISISENEKLRELVLPTQIANLDDYHGFYSLPGNYPIVSFYQQDYKSKQTVAGFIKSNKDNHIYMLEGVQVDNGVQTNNDVQVDKDAQINADTSSFLADDTNLTDIPDYILDAPPIIDLDSAGATKQTTDLFENNTIDLFDLKAAVKLNSGGVLEKPKPAKPKQAKPKPETPKKTNSDINKSIMLRGIR